MFITSQVLPSLIDIYEPFNGILLDAYGVFWGGNQTGLYSGAKETMEKIVLNKKIVGILSNSTQLVARELDKFERHGLIKGQHFHFLITSGEVARQLFQTESLPFETPKKKYWLSDSSHPSFSSPHLLFSDSSYTEASTIEEADFIYISIPHINGEDQTDPEVFREKVKKLVQSNLPMVCANPDRFAFEGNPARLVVRQGSIAALYEEMGGHVLYIGKPSSLVYAIAMEQFRHQNILNQSEILMVGDTPETDIRGARHFGISSALVTQTGIMADRLSQHNLGNIIQTYPSNDLPNFYIQKLANHAI